ncbi:unnamed protein product [Clonostachys chloroleuca]|uniref:Uncharacterized protein n=1 Tax=Clonostachys chloroleuca TaxID=1926264 RepID=A0AA35Q8I6_9HYPO|nr:unnamed protein product [Clonostachys chloroleuca]
MTSLARLEKALEQIAKVGARLRRDGFTKADVAPLLEDAIEKEHIEKEHIEKEHIEKEHIEKEHIEKENIERAKKTGNNSGN